MSEDQRDAAGIAPDTTAGHVEEVEISGHIIDSLILPKILDCITSAGGTFRIKNISIGQARSDSSFALVEVRAEDAGQLKEILAQISDHGAVPTETHDARLTEADVDGAFPEGFYSTTNQRTEIRIGGSWIEIDDQEMDCGVVLSSDGPSARCLPMTEVRRGDQIVTGHTGVRVFPYEREVERKTFEFMNSGVSTEKPKGVAIREIAAEIFRNHASGGKTLVVGGPAIIHTGSGGHLAELIRRGYVDKLFAGNALAAHDVEQAMFGTSLGVHLEGGQLAEAGHEHHLRAINRIRRVGSIPAAVEQGLLTSGVMYECVQHNVDVFLAGSIRDDGPLPEVETDALVAQRIMREKCRDVTLVLMIATMLHSIAVGNLLPAWVRVICIDINPSTVIKLSDRGSFQTVGLVTDVEPFLRSLVDDLTKLETASSAITSRSR
ncbi:MAG: TIGR00300 family protein [Planctomycetes bacterium]|nr:TIGR00300 family protein [Planctomycetota bacterium]